MSLDYSVATLGASVAEERLDKAIASAREEFAQDFTTESLSEGIISVLIEAVKLYFFFPDWTGAPEPILKPRAVELNVAITWITGIKETIAESPAAEIDNLTVFMDETLDRLLACRRSMTPLHTRASLLATRYAALLCDYGNSPKRDKQWIARRQSIQDLEEGLIFQQQPLGPFVAEFLATLTQETILRAVALATFRAELIEIELLATLQCV